MILRERVLGFRICTPCTLNCQLCSTCTPEYKKNRKPYYVSVEEYQRECREVFQIYDHVGCVAVSGGEPLLHPQLPELTAYTLKEFSSRFDCFRITTNGTLVPKDTFWDVVCSFSRGKVEFVIDDYGTVSNNIANLVDKLKKYDIPYRIDRYDGDEQYCGGWVDFGPLNERRNYSAEYVKDLVQNCHFAQWKCLDILKGKLFLCPRASIGYDLGYFDLEAGTYIDLFDSSKTLEEKQKIASELGTYPINACQYCNGFDPVISKRYPGGVQI